MTQSPSERVVIFSTSDAFLPAPIREWLATGRSTIESVGDESTLMSLVLRGRPRLVIIDGRGDLESSSRACMRLKADSYTGIVPTIIVCATDDQAVQRGFVSGADEVLTERMCPGEMQSRLAVTVSRADRSVEVHPSTRLPGAVAIEVELGRRIATGEVFAVCYADLDHFKEYNDRYSYYEGDRVIRILAKILHDVVKGTCGERGFVGHIGGDDFLFVIPASDVTSTCSEIVNVFDLLVPFQYSEPDRRAGYFFGKDRRGQLHRVPLMTLSIGVVTNERRAFVTPSQVSELATEMKGYAKTLTGSVFSVDRRQEHLASPEATPVQPHQAVSIVED